MSRILLLGSEGMLGSALARVLGNEHRITALKRSDFDIESAAWKSLPVAGYDYVLNAAGMINKRTAPPETFYAVNAVFPHVLAALCARAGVRLLHFSTDCVFSGTAAPYFEDSPTGAEDLYGRSKTLGEPVGGMVIRTSIIGPELRNGYNLLCWTLAQQAIRGFTNIFWNGLTTVTLARAVGAIIAQDLYVEGVRHLHSTDCSKFDMVSAICSAYGNPAQITPVEWETVRDMRLRTRHTDLLARLAIPPIAEQIATLATLSDRRGYWNA